MFEIGKKYVYRETQGKTMESYHLFKWWGRCKYIPKEIIILSKSDNVYLAVDDKGKKLAVDDNDSEMYIEAEQKQVSLDVFVGNNINKLVVGKAGGGRRFTVGEERDKE